MPATERELDELRQRVARLEVALAWIDFEKSLWGRVLRFLSIAAISLVVMLIAPSLIEAFSRLFR
jgi:hypothetical protein